MIDGKLQKRHLIINLYRLLDIALSLGSFAAAYYIRKYFLPFNLSTLQEGTIYLIIPLLIVIIWFLMFLFFDVDAPIGKKLLQIQFNVIKAVTAGIIILVVSLFFFKIHNVSRLLLGTFYIINMIALVISKAIVYKIYRTSEKSDYNRCNILIIGSKERAAGAISLINSCDSRYFILGCLDINKDKIGKVVKEGIKIIGTVDDIQSILLNNVVDEIIFAMPMHQIDNVEAYIQLIELMGIRVRIFPDWNIHSLFYEPRIATIFYDELNGIPSMVLSSTTTRQRDLLIKLFLDYILSGVALIMLFPLHLLIAMLIKITSPGPIFFKQERVGLNGRKFQVYKYRTMVKDAEKKLAELQAMNEADGPAFKIKKDPRIIPVIGTFLRKSSLDELPQLFNIFKGEMSLIGPRPPLCNEVAKYNVWHRRRLSMKPGITCIWQIQPRRNELSFDEWMDLDLEYIDAWSLKLDAKIFFKTIGVMLGGQGR
ncbi:MAG: sugar transferase [Spirochaetes bacterium]|nr:sugar transferase [Spirochaetota bacterium]